jgi:hypothetical protein
MKFGNYLLYVFMATFLQMAKAQISPLESDAGESYYYTDHYEVVIDKPVSGVWPFIIDMGSWMTGLNDANESSPAGVEGETFRLYGNFYMEVVKVIPEKMLLLVNLPNTQEGEDTQGVAMITAQEADGKTLVSIFMNRIYLWSQSEKNVLRERRESSNHAANRKVMYKEKFLTRLKELVEEAK